MLQAVVLLREEEQDVSPVTPLTPRVGVKGWGGPLGLTHPNTHTGGRKRLLEKPGERRELPRELRKGGRAKASREAGKGNMTHTHTHTHIHTHTHTHTRAHTHHTLTPRPPRPGGQVAPTPPNRG